MLGFTLVELLVVIAIVGILAALLLPAVQSAREATRRSQCNSQIRQIGLAFHLHHDVHGFLPSGGWGYRWTGDPDRGSGKSQPGSWAYSCLPFLEQQALYEQGQGLVNAAEKSAVLTSTMATPVPVFYCPTRRAAVATPNRAPVAYAPHNANHPDFCARSDYAANVGPKQSAFSTYWFTGPTPQQAYKGDGFRENLFEVVSGVVYQRSEISFRHITDGTSNTLMVGEKYLMPDHYQSGESPADDHSAWVGDDFDMHKTTSLPPAQDQPGVELVESFGSAHSGVFLVAMCDASTRQLTFDIAADVYHRLGDRNGQEPVADQGR